MVMLDILLRNHNTSANYSRGEINMKLDYSPGDIIDSKTGDIIIAHFNHGTRKSAEDDASFVAESARKYHLAFAQDKAILGENICEETARVHRYNFLHKVARNNAPAEIYTAHHLDDLVETIAINFTRGTGWRGLAALDTLGVRRPFLEPELLPFDLQKAAPFAKTQIYKYAAEFAINFRQDPTNFEDNYLRNRLREKLNNFPAASKQKLYILWCEQKKLKHEIDNLVAELLPKPGEPWQRSWFATLDNAVALELLRAGTKRAGISATRPQLLRFLDAILAYAPGKTFNLPQDKLIKFSKTSFYL